MIPDRLKMRYIEAVYQAKALLIKDEPFTLRSGKLSHVYLNHRNFLTQSKYLRLINECYNALISECLIEYKLVVVDSIMSPIISGAMSLQYHRDIVVVKSKKLEHGTKCDIYGDIESELVIIDDMTSTGGTIIEVAKKIRDNGGKVSYCVVSACRDRTAEENLQKYGITLLYIASFKEIINRLSSKLTSDELDIINRKTFEV